jgi:hypothetical protein
MRVTVESYQQMLCPWDLTVSVAERDYTVRPVTLGDMAALHAIESQEQKDMQRIGAFVASLLDPAPDVAAWQPEQVLIVLNLITTYWSDVTKKNQPKLAEALAGGLETSAAPAPRS